MKYSKKQKETLNIVTVEGLPVTKNGKPQHLIAGKKFEVTIETADALVKSKQAKIVSGTKDASKED